MSENLSYSAKGEVANLVQRRTKFERLKIALSKAPFSAWFGMIVLFIYFFAAIFAPLIAPHGEAEIFPVAYAPWGDGHIFGTDQIGRDIFSRIIPSLIGVTNGTIFSTINPFSPTFFKVKVSS